MFFRPSSFLLLSAVAFAGCIPFPAKDKPAAMVTQEEIIQLHQSLKTHLSKIAVTLENLKNSDQQVYEKNFAVFQTDLSYLESLTIKRVDIHKRLMETQKPLRNENFHPAAREAELHNFLQELKLISSYLDVDLKIRRLKESSDMLEAALKEAQRLYTIF